MKPLFYLTLLEIQTQVIPSLSVSMVNSDWLCPQRSVVKVDPKSGSARMVDVFGFRLWEWGLVRVRVVYIHDVPLPGLPSFCRKFRRMSLFSAGCLILSASFVSAF